ncbi:unnamed protein product, partial [Tenebrio molitor]
WLNPSPFGGVTVGAVTCNRFRALPYGGAVPELQCPTVSSTPRYSVALPSVPFPVTCSALYFQVAFSLGSQCPTLTDHQQN